MPLSDNELPDSIPVDPPDDLATPEGDNESAPGQPLSPVEPTPQRPRGDEPHSVQPLYPALD